MLKVTIHWYWFHTFTIRSSFSSLLLTVNRPRSFAQ